MKKKKMGRPPKYGTARAEQVLIRMTPAMREILELRAEETNSSTADYAFTAVVEKLARDYPELDVFAEVESAHPNPLPPPPKEAEDAK